MVGGDSTKDLTTVQESSTRREFDAEIEDQNEHKEEH